MNKLFYPKLAGQNIIKNGKFYFPYLLTVVISAAAFYIMTALSYYNDLPEKQRYDYLMMFMTLGSFVLALFIVIFLSYTNSFLMKRRSKELGLYNILGMGKGSIGLVLCWESLYTWLCGIVIGIPLGMLFQKLVMMVVGRMMRFNTVFEFYVSVKGIAATAILFAAVIAVMAQISIPMPLGVPMTMQTFAITLAAVVLGSKLSAIATLVYLALGAVGVPVLANFSGGFDKFVGPTGGFLISFPLMAYIIGLGVEHRDAFKGAFVTAVIVGTVVNYVVGVAMFVVVAHSTIAVGITACVLPFIPTAIIKAVLACAIGLNLRKRIPGLKA